MAKKHILETKLRPPVELYTAAVCFTSATLCVYSPWAFALTPQIAIYTALGFGVLGTVRAKEGYEVLRYQRNIKRLPKYEMTSKQIPVSRKNLFMGKGFKWTREHTQRLIDADDPNVQKYITPSGFFNLARYLEKKLENTVLSHITQFTQRDAWYNPVRPLPPVGGKSMIHGVEPNETEAYLPLGERVGHTVVFGTTRVGKTRLCEVYVTQDIHRGDVTIVFDPKGDADLLKRVYAECKRANRLNEFYMFHLGHPELSARYNAVGRFGRVSEVASRVAGQLNSAGNSAAFKEFAWRFVNIIARALVGLGKRPDYAQIARYVINMDELFVEYAMTYFNKYQPNAAELIVKLENEINERNLPFNMKGREKRVIAIDQYITLTKTYDTVLDGLRSAIRYDKTYFDKIVASLLPLLEKLTSGKTAELLAPNYSDLRDDRPIFDWMQVIRKRGVVYVGLDAMSDTEVAAAVGNSMFADLVSVAGWIYKHGIDEGLPGQSSQKDSKKIPINIHADEFNELMGDEFIPLINKGGGAGIQVTAYTQTLSDIEARIGNAAKAGQVIGNFNNLQMLRVREPKTGELLTNQLPKVNILVNTLVSGATDVADPTANTEFTSSSQDRVSLTSVPMLEPAIMTKLPKGQMFSLQEGGELWKVRMPLPKPDPDDILPDKLQDIIHDMRSHYNSGAREWWKATHIGPSSIDGFDELLASYSTISSVDTDTRIENEQLQHTELIADATLELVNNNLTMDDE